MADFLGRLWVLPVAAVVHNVQKRGRARKLRSTRLALEQEQRQKHQATSSASSLNSGQAQGGKKWKFNPDKASRASSSSSGPSTSATASQEAEQQLLKNYEQLKAHIARDKELDALLFHLFFLHLFIESGACKRTLDTLRNVVFKRGVGGLHQLCTSTAKLLLRPAVLLARPLTQRARNRSNAGEDYSNQAPSPSCSSDAEVVAAPPYQPHRNHIVIISRPGVRQPTIESRGAMPRQLGSQQQGHSSGTRGDPTHNEGNQALGAHHAQQNQQQQQDAEIELASDSQHQPGLCLGDIPDCVAQRIIQYLDYDGMRVLRQVSRSLYWEVNRHVRTLTVTPGNLGKLCSMPMHVVFPSIQALKLQPDPAASSHQPHGTHASIAHPSPAASSSHPRASHPPSSSLGGWDQRLLIHLAITSLPYLSNLGLLDVSDPGVMIVPGAWHAIVSGLPVDIRVIMREGLVVPRQGGAGAGGGAAAGGQGAAAHHQQQQQQQQQQQLVQQQAAQQLQQGQVDNRDLFPPLLAALRDLAQHCPRAAVQLAGVTVRRHTAVRLPALCQFIQVQALTLYGKSAVVVPHGHRLAGHLPHLHTLRHLTRLELLSYEDISDVELAPLAGCPHLRHLYVDSLFIKQATGPTFPSITSLTTARVKFILRPLTDIFPSLTCLRLGVLYSELNKKVNSVSLSCLAGCGPQLQQLVVCPVLWKGQWQVLPSLPGLTTLVLAYCRELSHLREVLKVVGTMPRLRHLELQNAAPYGATALGAASDAPPLLPQLPLPVPLAAAGGPGGLLDAALLPLPAAAAADAAAAAAAAAALAGGPGGVPIEAGDGAQAVCSDNLFQGLQGCTSLQTLVVQECSSRVVRHLAHCPPRALRHLIFRRMGSELKLADLQCCMLSSPKLVQVTLEASGDFSVQQAQQLPEQLDVSVEVEWRSRCTHPSLSFTRGSTESSSSSSL